MLETRKAGKVKVKNAIWTESSGENQILREIPVGHSSSQSLYCVQECYGKDVGYYITAAILITKGVWIIHKINGCIQEIVITERSIPDLAICKSPPSLSSISFIRVTMCTVSFQSHDFRYLWEEVFNCTFGKSAYLSEPVQMLHIFRA